LNKISGLSNFLPNAGGCFQIGRLRLAAWSCCCISNNAADTAAGGVIMLIKQQLCFEQL
jgi:hypothetical protein